MRDITGHDLGRLGTRLALACTLACSLVAVPASAMAQGATPASGAFEEVSEATAGTQVLVAQAEGTVAARELLALVNETRVSEGASKLGWDSELEKTARLRAKEISEVFDHKRPDGSSCFTAFPELEHGYRAENIAKGQMSAGAVNTSWTNSEGHFKNIVDENMHAFAAACYTDADGLQHWVECFSSAEPKDNGSQESSWSRLAGANRYQTMQKIVANGFSKSAHAVVASGASFPDALCAAALAGAHDCPVILTSPGQLSAEAASELGRLEVSEVTIMGGEGSVSASVASTIESMGISVSRVSADDRYGTSVEALRAVRRAGSESSTVIIAAGTSFADSLSVGPYAYQTASPVVLATAAGTLTQDAVEAITGDGTIERVVLLGGTASVSGEIADQLGYGYEYVRLGGENRYETSAKIASWETDEGLSFDMCAVASGTSFPDALAASALVGRSSGILVLASKPSDETVSLVAKSDVGRGYVLGGEGSVSQAVEDALK